MAVYIPQTSTARGYTQQVYAACVNLAGSAVSNHAPNAQLPFLTRREVVSLLGDEDYIRFARRRSP